MGIDSPGDREDVNRLTRLRRTVATAMGALQLINPPIGIAPLTALHWKSVIEGDG